MIPSRYLLHSNGIDGPFGLLISFTSRNCDFPFTLNCQWDLFTFCWGKSLETLQLIVSSRRAVGAKVWMSVVEMRVENS